MRGYCKGGRLSAVDAAARSGPQLNCMVRSHHGSECGDERSGWWWFPICNIEVRAQFSIRLLRGCLDPQIYAGRHICLSQPERKDQGTVQLLGTFSAVL